MATYVTFLERSLLTDSPDGATEQKESFCFTGAVLVTGRKPYDHAVKIISLEYFFSSI